MCKFVVQRKHLALFGIFGASKCGGKHKDMIPGMLLFQSLKFLDFEVLLALKLYSRNVSDFLDQYSKAKMR